MLRVVGALGTRADGALGGELARFLEAGHGEMTIDMSGVDFVSTVHFASLGDFLVSARELGRRVVVIAGEGLTALFRLTRLSDLAEIRAAA